MACGALGGEVGGGGGFEGAGGGGRTRSGGRAGGPLQDSRSKGFADLALDRELFTLPFPPRLPPPTAVKPSPGAGPAKPPALAAFGPAGAPSRMAPAGRVLNHPRLSAQSSARRSSRPSRSPIRRRAATFCNCLEPSSLAISLSSLRRAAISLPCLAFSSTGWIARTAAALASTFSAASSSLAARFALPPRPGLLPAHLQGMHP